MRRQSPFSAWREGPEFNELANPLIFWILGRLGIYHLNYSLSLYMYPFLLLVCN